MERKELFKQFIEECRNANPEQICGLGNPDADILLIGQEHFAPGKVDWKEELHKNYDICKSYGPNTTYIKPKGELDANGKIKRLNHTWCNYQKLINKVYGRESNQPDMLDFEYYAFTTELNSIPKSSSKTKDIKEKRDVEMRIRERLKLLKESEFINRSFPVIVLACGWYIKNDGIGDDRQIDNTFNVEYDGDGKGNYTKDNKGYSLGNWFYTHHNRQDTRYFKAYDKLVIHTRQLSGAVSDKLIEDMAEKINNHLHQLELL